MDIFLIRHGRQSSNLCNVNVGLSKEGHEQGELVAKRLKAFSIDGIYSSKLIRAQETAKHIADELNLPIVTIEGIEEIEFGDWTGISDKELDKMFPEIRYRHYHGLEDIRYPNAENGEDCAKRYDIAMQDIIRQASNLKQERIVVVTHGMAMRAWLCKVFNMPYSNRGILAQTLENSSITEIGYNGSEFMFERFNDAAHLEGHDELLRKHFK
ncbi:MAG: histidine phosphatase family protein [Lachnospiraceae bacterium]|nr:histidine phosphatase family protein [Lachnospiraceae bacterium]